MSIFDRFKRKKAFSCPVVAADIAIDTKAAAASLSLLAAENSISETSRPLDITRHQILNRILAEMELPGRKNTGIVLLSLWANVADRAMSGKTTADISGLSESLAIDAMEALYSIGLMARGDARDGITYYKLTEAGLNAGRFMARDCLKLSDAVPFD
ncbi:hypothetical protein LJR098_001054 [Rhizobium sp. LjRoot98]|uniref:hypothetical protein n=1 Tax=Rhizobium sp. LjRoot98 TaxID=3342345 RepID=UPI003ECE2E15